MSTLDKAWYGLWRENRQSDRLWFTILLLGALVLFLMNLGGLPLRDWDEGTVAKVAREIWQSSPSELVWLHPELNGQPYINKPPLVHWLIAIAYDIGGVNEWMARLPGALLTALSVPLMYVTGRELFPRRLPALLSALVFLTFLPVVRLGRLAMLDGAVVFFSLLMLWCVLRARRDVRFSLGIGLSLGLLCLTKGVMLAVLMGAIALSFLVWDTPRLLTQPYLWLGIFLGAVPVGLWYGAQWQQYGLKFVVDNLGGQSALRIWEPVENNGGPPWYYLLELLKYGAPWILFLPAGFRSAWENRVMGWAKLSLVWSIGYFSAITLMMTKLPWYILPLFPALSFVVGAQLADMWERGKKGIRQPNVQPYSSLWVRMFALLALAGLGGSLYFGFFSAPRELDLATVMAAVGITMLVVSVLLSENNANFITVLIWGSYLGLLLFMLSGHWVWELAEDYPVKPVAVLVQRNTLADEEIYTSHPHHRPSLDFYSNRQISPRSEAQIKEVWQQNPQVYLLLDQKTKQELNLQGGKTLGTVEGWSLLFRGR